MNEEKKNLPLDVQSLKRSTQKDLVLKLQQNFVYRLDNNMYANHAQIF